MPYIITTTNPALRAAFEEAGGRGVDLAERLDAAESRRAFATLEEAQTRADDALDALKDGDEVDYDVIRDARTALHMLPEQGGTVGPLPDGTVITVEPVGWWKLGELSGLDFYPATDGHRKIIDAYNAAQDG